MKISNKIFLIFAMFLLANLPQLAYSGTASLLPNGEQQFLDSAGTPYAGGQVYFYIPNTTTQKTTWQDATESAPNTNPVILDSGGRALIYGSGQYREILYDECGNLIWDALTQDVNSLIVPGQTVWGGTATGTANALLLTSTPAITSLSAGQAVSFIGGTLANTAASTVNISSVGVKNILVTTSSGTATLSANNIVPNGRYFMVYDGTSFILLNPSFGTSGTAFSTLTSASTTDLGTAATTNIAITGTNTITSFGSSASTTTPLYVLQFSGSLQITYNSSTMLTPNSRSLITQPGDYALVRYQGTGIWRIIDYFPASGYIGKVNVQRFTSSVTYTPANNLLYAEVEIVGGGGGGGAVTAGASGSSGGASGGYLKVLVTATDMGASQAITVGTAGTAGSGGAGGNGGTSSVGSLISCSGGNGGAIQNNAGGNGGVSGGTGGSCSTSVGTIMNYVPGQSGGYGANNFLCVGGSGGSNPLGSGGAATAGGPNAAGNSATGYGAGGSGAIYSSGASNGGSGSVGEVIITEYVLR